MDILDCREKAGWNYQVSVTDVFKTISTSEIAVLLLQWFETDRQSGRQTDYSATPELAANASIILACHRLSLDLIREKS